MKLKFYTATFVTTLLCSGLVSAEITPQAAYIEPRVTASILTDIVRTSAGFIIVGERGHILISADGETWQQAQVPVQSSLNSVFFVNEKQGWAVGHDVTILHTVDGGQTWQLQNFQPELDKPLFDIVFQDDLNGVAVGAYGLMYRTSDSGKTWVLEYHAELANADDFAALQELKETDEAGYQEEVSSVLPHLNRMLVDGQQMYVVGEGGLFAKSTDFGRTWQRSPEFYHGSLFGIAQNSHGVLMTVGLRGHAFISRDFGNSWQQVALPSPATLNSASATTEGFLLTGNSGSVYLSSDQGSTFSSVKQPDGKAVLNGLLIDGKLLLVTEVGVRHSDLMAGK